MTILIIGGTGQIGFELTRSLAAFGSVVAPPRAELDLLDQASIAAAITRVHPMLVVNAAGYTAVDRAESEPELCAAVNVHGPAMVAAECRRAGAPLIHFSTDYVFDGTSEIPYIETDATGPTNVYGTAKRDGEAAIVAAGGAYIILRTSWVYTARGTNFVRTILRLARERDELRVVNDQTGAPTSAASIARGVASMLMMIGVDDWRANFERVSGTYHMTAAGSTTWYDFARHILADDPRKDEQRCRSLTPITSEQFGGAAPRPAYSCLDCSKLAARFGVRLGHWTDGWRETVAELAAMNL